MRKHSLAAEEGLEAPGWEVASSPLPPPLLPRFSNSSGRRDAVQVVLDVSWVKVLQRFYLLLDSSSPQQYHHT